MCCNSRRANKETNEDNKHAEGKERVMRGKQETTRSRKCPRQQQEQTTTVGWRRGQLNTHDDEPEVLDSARTLVTEQLDGDVAHGGMNNSLRWAGMSRQTVGSTT